MARTHKHDHSVVRSRGVLSAAIVVIAIIVIGAYVFATRSDVMYDRASAAVVSTVKTVAQVAPKPELDRVAYDKKMLELANNPVVAVASSTASTTPAKETLWPVKAAYPKAGALLPFHRIVAYYGNFYSKGMGVLGQYPEDVVIEKLNAEVAKWNAADPSTPVMPAIEYIDVTAQESPGKEGLYSLRMPDSEIDKAIAMAAKVHGIVILDVQVGLSTLQRELPLIETYLKMPQVHLALDPEFSMKSGAKPGTEIGTFSSADINYAAEYLARLVRENDLPPKILVVHRFTRPMVTGYQNIKPLPEVQIIMDMDGWGSPAKKLNTYNSFIASEPVQFTGFKLFYKNDLKPPSTRLLTTEELLDLTPRPIFIQYQ